MIKFRQIMWVFAIIVLIIAVICDVTVSQMTAEYAAELAVEQMETEGSMEYAAYHQIIQNLHTTEVICFVLLVAYVVYESVQCILWKRNSSEQ